MYRVYMLIKIARGEEKAQKFRDMLRKVSTVKHVGFIAGPWDIIAIIEAETEKEVLHDTVIENICNMPDVIDTLTLPEVSETE